MEQKKLLKKYLDKLTKNKVVYANGKVIRTSNLNHTAISLYRNYKCCQVSERI